MPERTVEYEQDVVHVPEADFVDQSSHEVVPHVATGTGGVARRTSQALRRELSARNVQRAATFAHEVTYGSTPAVVYREQEDGTHGNFFPASYRRILAHPEWSHRLRKTYTASHRMAYGASRRRQELDCANSSDALLMNVFCHPATMRSKRLHALLGIGASAVPEFGVRARVPLRNGHNDRTEVDLRLTSQTGVLLVEAKLSEVDFQVARPELMARYGLFPQTFAVDLLPRTQGHFRSYQLLRSVLAARYLDARFAVLLDARRSDLLEDAFLVFNAVSDVSLRSRLHVMTWQEIAACVPRTLEAFLLQKYGIEPAH